MREADPPDEAAEAMLLQWSRLRLRRLQTRSLWAAREVEAEGGVASLPEAEAEVQRLWHPRRAQQAECTLLGRG